LEGGVIKINIKGVFFPNIFAQTPREIKFEKTQNFGKKERRVLI